MTTARQLGFSNGQIGKAGWARVDQDFYALGLRTLRNGFIERGGPASSRAGTVHCDEVQDSTQVTRLIPFIFSPDPTQDYAIELSPTVIRFYKSRQLVTEPATLKPISAATKASPCKLTVTGHGLTTGDHIVIPRKSVVGMRELNGRQYIVTVVDTNNITLARLDGTAINSTTYGTYVSGGTVARVYKIASPYLGPDLFRIYYTQSADVVTLSHPKYGDYHLSRFADANWTLTKVVYGPDIPGPSGIAFSAASGLTGTSTYQVTSISQDTGEESLPGIGSSVNVEAYALAASGPTVTIKKTGHGLSNGNAVTLVSPGHGPFVVTALTAPGTPAASVVFTVTGHGLTTGDTLLLTHVDSSVSSLFDNPNVNNLSYVITVIDANRFTLAGVTSGIGFSFSAGPSSLGWISQPYLVPYSNLSWTITVVDADHFMLNGATTSLTLSVSSNPNATYSSNAVSHASSGTPSATNPNTITWNAVPGALQYKVYLVLNGLASYLATTTSLSFTDQGLFTADPSKNPPLPGDQFNSPGNYPGVCAYYQDRLWLARTDNSPETAFASQPGRYLNFSTHVPQQDDDEIKATLTGNQVNEIRHLVNLQRLIILTSGCELVADGDASGTVTPSAFNDRTFSYNGVSYVRPVVVDNVLLFIQELGAQLIGLTFDEFGRHELFDLSLPSLDLFEGHQIIDMAYQKVPNSVVWLLRDDGQLISFTFSPTQGIKGFALHDTPGFVESICCIPEANQTALYMVVRRDLPNYPSRRYVEVLETRTISDVKTFVGMDSSRTTDNRFTSGAFQVKLMGGTTWLAGDPLTCQASVAGLFTPDMVGGAVVLRGWPTIPGGETISATITAYTDSQHVTVVPTRDVPVAMQGVFVGVFDLAAVKITELWHLEGTEVAVLADGATYASPNNPDVDAVALVTNGTITLSAPAGAVIAGRPFITDVQTLNLDTAQGETLMGKKKRTNTLMVFVKESFSLWAGPNPPSNDSVDPTEDLVEYDASDLETDDDTTDPDPLVTDIFKVRIEGRYNNNGRVFIRNLDPMPLSILSIAPAGDIPVR